MLHMQLIRLELGFTVKYPNILGSPILAKLYIKAKELDYLSIIEERSIQNFKSIFE